MLANLARENPSRLQIRLHQGTTCTTDVLLRIQTEQNSVRTDYPLNDVLCKWIALTSMRSNFVSLLWDMIISIVTMACHTKEIISSLFN